MATTTPIEVTAEVKQYTLVGDDIYVKRYTNENIPTWYSDMVSTIIAGDNTIADQSAAIAYLESLAPGYSISITQLQDKDLQIDTVLDSLVTTTGDHTAAIANLDITKVDSTSAAAISLDTIGAYFADGSAASYFNSYISTYASNIAANASSISTLSASLGSTNVRIDTVDEINIQQASELVALNTALDDVVSTMIPELQSQIDGQIDTWFYTGEPTMVNAPANTWSDNTTKLNHVGDLYYDKATGYGYRFAYEDIVDDPDMGIIYSWIQITDIDVVLALANASTAQATADGKRTVFYRNTLPVAQVINGTTVPLEKGDLWVNSDTNVTKIAVIDNPTTLGHWGDITNTDTENALLAISTLEETNDGVVNTFYQGSAPTTGMTYGDWWIETDTTPIRSYRYEGENGKNVGVVSWVYKDPTTNILANAMVTSDTAKVKIDQVVAGTLAIDITNATVDGTAIGTYVAKEIDKEVVILSGTATPTTDPTTPVGKLNDIYLQKGTVTGASGVVVDVVNTWKHNGTIWVAIGNNDNLIALADLTDGKRTIYSNMAENVPNIAVQLNDMWIPSTTANGYNANEVYLYKGLTLGWVIATNYTDDTAANSAQVTANAKSQILYSAVAPTVLTHPLLDIGDQWVDTTNGLVKVWSGTAWVDVVAKSTAEVLQQLVDLEEARDGSVVIYYETSTTIPIGMTYGDYLVDTDSLSGSSYTVYRYENATGGSSGTLAWYVNTGETAKALSAGYRAQVLAGTAQATADGKATVYYKAQAEIDAITTAWTTQQKLDNIGDMWVDSTTGVSKIWNTTAWVNVATVDANTALAKLSDLEEARDGVVNTYYVTTAPASGMSYGDYWVDTDSWDGSKYAVYRHADVNGQSTGTLSWYVNTGETAVAISKAYRADVLAGTAQSTADGKIKTWYQSTAPVLTASDIGDIWVDTDAGNLTKTWSGTDWVDIINTQSNTAYTWSANASKLITAPDGSVTGWSFGDGSNTQSYFKVQATNFSISDGTTGYTPFLIDGTNIKFNGLVEFTNITGTPIYNVTYFQTTAPDPLAVDLNTGDIWYDTDDNNSQYRWNGTTWEDASSTSDNSIFRQTSAPISPKLRDMWIDSDDNNKTYWYDGTAWQLVNQDAAEAINSGTTTIAGSKITTGSITASQIAADTITASQIAANAITTNELAANAVIAENILAGTITGDKIVASTITADKLSVTTLSAISANMGTITAGSITADLITAGTIAVGRLPGLSVQNLNQRTVDITLNVNNTVTSFSPGITVPTNPTTGWVTVATFSHVKSTAKVKLSAQLSLNGQTPRDYKGTGYLWGRITRNGAEVIRFLLGPAYRFSMIQQSNGGQRTSFEAVDTYNVAGTYVYDLDLVVSDRLSTDTNWHCKDAYLSSFEVIV